MENLDSPLFFEDFSENDINEISKLHGPILVVGASGFIGFNLFAKLSKYRKDVYGTATQLAGNWRLNSLPREELSRIRALDLTDSLAVKSLITGMRPRTVFNLSAYGAYERQSDSSRIHDVNYIGTLHLVQVLAEIGLKAFVNAGSSSEYGLNCAAPLETDTLLPNSDYAVSKAASALLIHHYGVIKGLPFNHLRLYSIYGPWEERDRLIPRIVELGLLMRYPPLVNPEISRDFVYVDDCLRAFLKSALLGCEIMPGAIFNIARGKKTTLREVADTARGVFNIPQEASFGSMPNRKWDLSNWFGNPTLAETKLSWQAKVEFAEGLGRCRKWETVAQPLLRFAETKGSSKKISAIIACYKDALAIPHMHARLTKAFQSIDVDYEIIFVNDGSPDADEEAIRKISETDSKTIGITHSRNFGSQAAFMSGLGVASGDAAVFLDGDLQDPPELIPDFVRKWKEGYDVVYGQRVKRDAPPHMRVLYKLFFRVFRAMAEIKIPVDAGDFSLIDRKVMNRLLEMNERDLFMRGLRAWVGYRQIGVPYRRPERMFGVTTNNFSKNIWWAKKAIFSFSTKPLTFIQNLGLSIFAVDCILMIYYLANYFLHPNENPRGVNTIILLVLGVGAVNLLGLSLIGDYIGKILEEVKHRPRFIRAGIVISGEKISGESEISAFVAKRAPLEKK